MMLDCEKIAVSATRPQFGDNGVLLLGVVLSDSSKGSDQAYNILNLLEYYEICDQIFAIYCDTISSNTGVHNRAVQLLSTTLNAQMLWLMCRHNIYEVHISHFMKALTGQETKGSRRQLYVRLQKLWPDVAKSIQAAASGNKLCLFDWSGVQVGLELHSMALEALDR